MRRAIVGTIAGLFVLAAVGCGGETVINTAPLTDEQKRASEEESQRVFEEEGGKAGKAGAAKPKK
jgi:hypothetical protein